jgi:hypothetical protein
VNRLTPAACDRRSFQPELKHAAVRLIPAMRRLDGLIFVGGARARRLADTLTSSGVRDVAAAGWDLPPPEGRPWFAYLDSSAACRRWVKLVGLSLPVVVDAGSRIAGRDGAFAAGTGVETVNGLPVSRDGARLRAALLDGGLAGPRALASCSSRRLQDGRVRFHAGAADARVDDDEQGVRCLRLCDSREGVEVTWRLAAGQALGVSAVGPIEVIDRVATAWFDDLSPEEVEAMLSGLTNVG